MSTLETLVLIAVLVTGAGGLGLLVSGSGPRESLHLLYGASAFATLPVAHGLTRNSSERRQAIVTLGASVLMLVLIARSLQTG